MSDAAPAVKEAHEASGNAGQEEHGNAEIVQANAASVNEGTVEEAEFKATTDVAAPEQEQSSVPAATEPQDSNDSSVIPASAAAPAEGSVATRTADAEAAPTEAAVHGAPAVEDGRGDIAAISETKSAPVEEETEKPTEHTSEMVESTSEKVLPSIEEKNGEAPKVEGSTTEEAKTEPTSPNTIRKQQKASFNVDAKPFSPVALADPQMQVTLVGEANGMSIKVGQWGNQPFVPLPHMAPAAPVGVGPVPYAVAPPPPPQPLRKDSLGAKESLSALAKPWSPHPEVTVAPIPPPENEVAIHPGSWSIVTVEGKEVQTPSPMMPKETSSNSFTHSFPIHPKGLKSVELEVYNYVCGRCPLKTLYGRLSSRQPDVTMRNVVMDIPPLCVAHLIEQVTKAKVTALCVNEAEGTHYDIWLDKPNMVPVLVDSMSGCVWTCPMHHGYAVLGKGEEGKKYLRNYVERLKDSRPEGLNVYEVALVEVKEH